MLKDRTVHIINPLPSPCGGDWLALDLFREFIEYCDIKMWTEEEQPSEVY